MIQKDLPLTLYQRAGRVVRGAVHNSPNTEESIMNFFKHANEKNLQGPALTAYYSAVLSANKDLGKDCFQKVIDVIEDKSLRNPELKKEINIFTKALNTNYGKTLGDRISLLAEGAVQEHKVNPVSKFRKTFALLNRLLRDV